MTETETLLKNEYTQTVTNDVQTITSTVFSSRFLMVVVLLLAMAVLFKIVDLVAKPIRRRNQSMLVDFFAAVIKAIIAIVIILRICSFFNLLSGITSQILMSSSLLVVVLGFVFQEGLTNIVHGFILSVSKPFRIGDRLQVKIDGETITGYVESMNLRSCVIRNVLNSSNVIVPNSKLDLCVIDNSYFDGDAPSSNFLDAEFSYESDLEHAIEVMGQAVADHPMVAEERKRLGESGPVGVMVRELASSGIALRATVVTRTVEQNFQACSDIRRELVKRVNADPKIEFAYPCVQIVTGINSGETIEELKKILQKES